MAEKCADDQRSGDYRTDISFGQVWDGEGGFYSTRESVGYPEGYYTDVVDRASGVRAESVLTSRFDPNSGCTTVDGTLVSPDGGASKFSVELPGVNGFSASDLGALVAAAELRYATNPQMNPQG